MQVLELALTQTSSSSSVQWSTDDDDALRPELRLELWTLVVGGRFVVVVVAVRAVDLFSPASWIGLLPPSVLTYTAQPAILSELLCILGAEACVVYVSRIGIHMKRPFGAGAFEGCC